MCCSSIINSNLTIQQLYSNANCILYTYGVGDSQTQAEPPYFRELARRNPSVQHEMIHCDALLTAGTRELLPNLKVRLIDQHFPISRRFDPQFQEYIEKKLQEDAEIFLGVHSECWTDSQCCLAETYNLFRERYPGKIHLYIQASDVPAFVYKGPYRPIMGLFARTMYHFDDWGWKTFRRFYSAPNPSESDAQWVRALMIHHTLTDTNRLFIQVTKREDAAITPYTKDLTDYVNHPLQNRVIVLPLEDLTPEIFSFPPGKEPLPPLQLSCYEQLLVILLGKNYSVD